MLKDLQLLLQLRSWLTSKTLKFAGAVTVLSTFLATPQGQAVLAAVAAAVHLSPGVLGGILAALSGLATAVLRAKTEWSLTEKNTGVDKLPVPAGPKAGGQS
jgi:hypothetical protein